MTDRGGTPARRDELAARLAVVRDRIARACDAHGRDPGEITLVAVTKFFPASDIDLLAELGVRAVGENRDQEASAKVQELRHRQDLSVHFIGQLQTNKASSVVRYADVIQSVDRPRLVEALDGAAGRAGTRPQVLLQVSLAATADEEGGPDAGRGGVDAVQLMALADQVAGCAHLELKGVMGVAPLGGAAAPAFARLQGLAERLRAAYPEATWLSAGMSGDLEEAVAHGATHLRVGSAILGSRQSHR